MDDVTRATDLIREAAIHELRQLADEADAVAAELETTKAQLAEAEAELERLRSRRSVRWADSLSRLRRQEH